MRIDQDGYPLEEDLEQVSKWVIRSLGDCKTLLEWVEPAFERFGRFEYEDGVVKVATGGWSGCEDVIVALKQNMMFWALCWEMSRRGGYFQFRVEEE